MAAQVEQALTQQQHLLVQAGTGTGKSLAYLVPALLHADRTGKPVVVATATLALQAQIVTHDLPQLSQAVTPLLGREPTWALVKGRRNYLCQHKLAGGYAEEGPGDTPALFGAEAWQSEPGVSTGPAGPEPPAPAAPSALAAQVLRLRQWARATSSGDRDELVPGVSETAWEQVSVSARECLGGKCPALADCFVERARAAAAGVDVVVTNHALMAVDAMGETAILPEHQALIVDEAHECVDRVTSAVTAELTPAGVGALAKRITRLSPSSSEVDKATQAFTQALEATESGRLPHLPEPLALALTQLRDAMRRAMTQLKSAGKAGSVEAALQQARVGAQEVFETAARLLAQAPADVAWVARDDRWGSTLCVAPMSVAGLIRSGILQSRTVVFTSATMSMGGQFEPAAQALGLTGTEGQSPAWRGIDVGSPFDYPRQGILYLPAHLPPPTRQGSPVQALEELQALILAAGGRTLGLFSSMRAARSAAEQLRHRLADAGHSQIRILCQGEERLSTLVRQFREQPTSCLFGTLSLWQGVDVPGSSCQLVVIDRIPFPRPDDPLTAARTEAAAAAGGNGFAAVSLPHAALRLAQGAGRLVRRSDDRGVVAILDSRLSTAGYGAFLQRCLPPLWPTTNRQTVLDALQRLDRAACAGQ